MSILSRIFPDMESLKKARRLIRIVIGGTLLFIGVLLIVLPGPAFVVIPIALAILATEFVWARILLRRVRFHINRFRGKSGDMPPED